nr:putative disease resistance protein RGA3 [Coffea arabica]
MPGQGKTTPAQLVYKNDKVMRSFDERMWLSVSDDFEVERLLNEMLQSLKGTNLEMTNREAIVRGFKNIYKEKNSLLVLDDIWNENREKWECMRKCLLETGGSEGSRILATTRSEVVASTMQTAESHRLEILSETDTVAGKYLRKLHLPRCGANQTAIKI